MLDTPAKELKASGVTVFAAGIGSDVSQSELQTIASSPSSDFVLNIGDFGSLGGLEKDLQKWHVEVHHINVFPIKNCNPRQNPRH